MNAREKYFENLMGLLTQVQEQESDKLELAAQKIADCVLNGGMLYTFGTGHGHLLALEIFYRAGGMVRVAPILDEKLMLHLSASESSEFERENGLADSLLERYPVKAGDVLIAISNSGRNAVPVELAAKCRERGAYVIALTSLKHTSAVTPRNALGKRLFEEADLVLDNCGILGDASVEGTGGRMVGATSTAVGSAILQSVIVRVEEIARERGEEIEFFASANIDGGDAINGRYLDKYRGKIRCL
ncbi:MAG: SIS domain-containing protein [Clostridia bacterium]|nr:SIS domain-containing protein [Clostridia bacterium]